MADKSRRCLVRGTAITDVLPMRRPWVLLLVALMLAVGCGPPRTGRTAAPVATDRNSSASAVDPLLDPLLDLLAQRFEVTTLVARAKWNAKLPVEDAAREQALLADLRDRARAHGLSGDWVETFFRAQIIEATARWGPGCGRSRGSDYSSSQIER